MRNEELDCAQRNFQLPQAYRSAAAAVEKQFLIASLHKRAWSKSVWKGIWCGGAEQCHSEIGTRRMSGLLSKKVRCAPQQKGQYRHSQKVDVTRSLTHRRPSWHVYSVTEQEY